LPTVLAGLGGCGRRSEPDEPGKPSDFLSAQQAARVRRCERSLDAAGRFLLSRQSDDGSWRSDVYGPFKDGGSLTPWVAIALLGVPRSARRDAACRKAVNYLAGMAKSDGTIDEGEFGLSYPVYTAAGVVLVLSRSEGAAHLKARDAWLTYLRQRQLTEDLGWQRTDKEYGGWGYASGLPRKPREEELTESNLSATAFALRALRAAGLPATDPAIGRALTFVERCQNYRVDRKSREAAYDDGGFFFIHDDPARNKAGTAGRDRAGRERFFSYGSTTADGLRSLVACGLPLHHPRVMAARRWLEAHFRADRHSGRFAPEREDKREAVYYYYAWSVAEALATTAGPMVRTDRGAVHWAEALADELVRRQRKDGSWVNPAQFVREDDPLVATPLATAALAICRAGVAGMKPSKN
jgi:squalene-hopene/tetraprenyl-beta-curcumene cyclase